MTGEEIEEELIPVLSPEEIKNRLKGTILRQFENDEEETNDFIERQIEIFIQNLESIHLTPSHEEDEEGLMERLIQSGLFPSFSFPLDVALFEAAGTKKRHGKSKSEPHIYARTSQDLKVALSSYQPGKRVTINKQT